MFDDQIGRNNYLSSKVGVKVIECATTQEKIRLFSYIVGKLIFFSFNTHYLSFFFEPPET